ncbi:hypothetical protein ACFQAT_01020 [Undibacterium arcticum]|uniref:DUF2946 domain-containing protein n=1 Tax=Undibacterium arcticum TaxID=1762892 RepID=A0ABV7EY32_9BURK
MKRRQTILPALLALLLLLSQQMGFAHAVSHISDQPRYSTSHGKQLPIEQVCEQCLAFAQIGSALPTHVFSLAADTAPDAVTLATSTPVLYPRPIRAFQSRAPPQQSVS